MNSAYKVKVLLSALTVALLAATPLVRAQDAAAPSAPAAAPSSDTPPPPPDDAAPMPKKGKKGGGDAISAVTGLTGDQKAQIKTIREATKAKIEALPDDDNKRDASRQIMMDSAKQVRALLTDDQKAQYDAAMKKMMRRKKAGDTPPPPPADAPSSSM
jgi:Spy/CpxP family protein refolding chaperone